MVKRRRERQLQYAGITTNVIHRSGWAIKPLRWLLLDQTCMLISLPLRLLVSNPTMLQQPIGDKDVAHSASETPPMNYIS